MIIETQPGAPLSCLPCSETFKATAFPTLNETYSLLASTFKELKTTCKEADQLPSQLFVIQDHPCASPNIYQLTFTMDEELENSLDNKEIQEEEKIDPKDLFFLVFPFFEKQVEVTFNTITPAIQNTSEVIRLLYTPIEKTVETLITTNSLSTVFTTTYIAPHSPFHNLEIAINLFDTHPRSIKIEFSGHPETIQKLLPHLKSLQEELQKRFQTIDIPTITAAYQPLFPNSSSQQKSPLKVSNRKETQGKIVIKSLKQML